MSLVRITEVVATGDDQTLVGGPPFGVVPVDETSGLQDLSDATWAEVAQPVAGNAGGVSARFDTSSLTPLSLFLTVRARYNPAGTSVTPGNNANLNFSLFRLTDDFSSVSLTSNLSTPGIDPSMELTDSAQTWTFDLATVLANPLWETFPGGLTFAEFVATFWQPPGAFSSALNLGTSAGFDDAIQIEVFEAYLTATFEGGAVETVNVTRQFPRDDQYGAGSAPRIHPPPRRGRIVGGQT